MLKVKFVWTLMLVAMLAAMASSAFAGPWVALEYTVPLTPTSVPAANDFTEPAFSDVEGDFWAWAEIEECSNTASESSEFIVQGYGDGSYQPTQNVTRAQMAVFIARAAGYTDDAPADPSFFDVNADYWAFTEIEQCVINGVVQGYADYFGDGVDGYLPAVTVDRGQMAVFVQRAAALTTAAYTGAFDDVADDFWAASSIQACVDANIVQGFDTDPPTYLPGNSVTRAQMAVFVWRGLVRLDGGDVVLGGPAVADDLGAYDPGDGLADFFLPDAVTATGANTVDGDDEDLPVAPDAIVFVVLDAAQVNDGDIVFEVSHVDDGGTPDDDTDDTIVIDDTETLTIVASDAKDAVDVAGSPYLLAVYHVDSTLTAEDYTLTVALPDGAVLTIGEFTVE